MSLNISRRRCQSFQVSTLPLSRLGSSMLNPVKLKHQDQPTNNRRGRIPQNDRHNVQRLDKQQRGEDEYSKRRVQEAQCRGKPVASDRDHRRLEAERQCRRKMDKTREQRPHQREDGVDTAETDDRPHAKLVGRVHDVKDRNRRHASSYSRDPRRIHGGGPEREQQRQDRPFHREKGYLCDRKAQSCEQTGRHAQEHAGAGHPRFDVLAEVVEDALLVPGARSSAKFPILVV
ncbi:hypothetical protein M432DRAFT_593517 [Thermoascus aurantiacus ATCC 26904]